jgi:hypothetical protein
MSDFGIMNFELSGSPLRVWWMLHKHHSEYFLNVLIFPKIFGEGLQTVRRWTQEDNIQNNTENKTTDSI